MGSTQRNFWYDDASLLQAGFTLLELLVTMLILTIGLLGTAGLTTGIIRGNFYSKNLTSATAIGQTTLEGAQRVGYLGVDAYVSDTTKVPPTVSMGDVTFSQSASVATASNMKTVTVSVTWTEANNASRSVTLQTILAQ